MAAEYQVIYNIEVFSSAAITNINKFKTALNSLTKATKPLTDLQRQVRSFNDSLAGLKRQSISLNTTQAKRQLNELLTMAREVKTALSASTMGTTRATRAMSRASAKASASTRTMGSTGHMPLAPRTTPYSVPARPSRYSGRTTSSSRYSSMPSTWPSQPKNLSYKLLGPTPLPNNGGMALDMLKGMGIAYGIAGVGQLFSNIVGQASEYDNTMKTVENILKSHDQNPNFNGRFANMTKTIRNVGMETKYTITEVADAAKFLAMAGLNTNAINQAIRPIADIALVGDTELGETADLVTNIMTAYNIAPSRMRRAADVMTNTFTMSNTTLTEIAEAYKYSAALLSAGGIDFEESAAAIGVLGDAGIKGSQAGTTLRTIMANVVNPTKKQSKAWQAIGVSTKGKNLIDIFKELNEKNLDVSMYYKLFHKTAAQGAVALADHVQKWNEVVVENFMSDGLSARLADEKKNTLQGLLAQLTSVFTDDGVKAFSGIQGGIRSFLKDAIEWLKSSQAQKIITEIFETFASFGRTLVDITKQFFGFYETFKPLILSWMKFQLMIWPVVKGLQAFKTVILSLAAVRGIATSMTALATSMWKVNGAAGAATAIAGGRSGMYVGPLGFLPGITHQQRVNAARGLELRRPHLMYTDMGSPLESEANAWNQAAIAQYRNNRKLYNRRLMRAQAWNGFKSIGGSMVGGALMGYGMMNATQEDASTADMVAGGLYAAAGVSAMVGGPWGWGIAGVLALGGVIANIVGHFERMQKIVDGFANFANSNKIINGVLVDSSDKTMKYLEFVYAKNDDINGLINRRIELTKELLGLQDTENSDFSSSGIFDKSRKDLWDLGWTDRWTSADYILGQWNSISQISKDNGIPVYNGIKYHSPQGMVDKAFSNDLAAAQELMNGGYYSGLVSDLQTQVTRRLLLGTSKDDWNSYWSNYYTENDPSKIPGLIRPDQFNESKYELEHWSKERRLQSYFARNEVFQNLEQIATPMREAIDAYLVEKSLGSYNENTIVNLLKYAYGGLASQYLMDYNPNDVAGWFRNMGYWDGTFHDYNGTDANTMAQSAIQAAQSIQEALSKLHLEGDPAAESLMNFTNTLIGQAEAYLGVGDAIMGEYDGQIKEFGNLTLQWDATNGVWNQIVGDNQLYMSTLTSNMNWFNSSIWGLGNTIGGYDWFGMWNSMLPRFNTTSFSGFGLGAGYNYGGSTLLPSSGLNTFSTTGIGGGFGNFSLTSGYKFGASSFGKSQFGFGNNKSLFGSPSYSAISFTPSQVGNMNGYKGKTGNGTNESGSNGGHTIHTPKVDNNDYRSKYQSNSAAPKQVIV